MKSEAVGMLHPGNMGISLAATILNGGHQVYWVSKGRSEATRVRADRFDLIELSSMDEMCERCSIIVSVCPPHAAEQVAAQVMACSYQGVYLDANAISPARTVRIGERVMAGGATYIDGGIVGGPAWKAGETWLYLSGPQAARAERMFAAGPMETTILGGPIGRASALKICYAAYTKGRTALVSTILAAAQQLEVGDELAIQWERDWPGFPEESVLNARRVTSKAWRFAGEMEEIAATFESIGLPGGFHRAAAELYQRIAGFKDAEETPTLEEVLAASVGSKSNQE